MMGKLERLIPVSQDLVGCVLYTPKFSSEGQHELTVALFDVSAWKVVFERNLSGKPELKSIACSLQRDVVFCAENDARKREMFFTGVRQMFPFGKKMTFTRAVATGDIHTAYFLLREM